MFSNPFFRKGHAPLRNLLIQIQLPLYTLFFCSCLKNTGIQLVELSSNINYQKHCIKGTIFYRHHM